MVDDWLDNAVSNGPIKANDEEVKPDQHGIKLGRYGNYCQYPAKTFEFKCLEGKDLAFDRNRRGLNRLQ